MATTDHLKRKRVITTTVVLGIAFVGLLLVTVGRSSQTPVYAAQAQVSADSTSYKPADALVGSGAATVSIIKMLAALVVVIGCIYLAIYLLKKLMGRRYAGNRKDHLLEILETAYIDPKKSLSLVRVADRSVLIGVTDNQISMLTELDSEKTQTITSMAESSRQTGGFGDMLRSASSRLKDMGGTASRSSLV